ncbi:FAD-dependent oxidoreductase [Skermania sp. ID1734]|nr:FAD-dependent oxidoreductase [Skermania sp. ID1734]
MGSAVVVGGGIGGLSTAVALQRRSWQVTVFERRPALSESGAGITLWPNALRALDALGIGTRIRGLGLAQSSGGMRDSDGRWLVRTDTAALAKRFGDGIIVLQRSELLTALRQACTDIDVRVSTEVRGVDANGTVTLGSGDRMQSDVVVGADGVWSVARQAVWPDAAVRSTGMLAARLVGRVGDPASVEGGESWGAGDYAGVAPLPDGRFYAYLVVPVTAEVPTEADAALCWWQRRFSRWHAPFPELLANLEPSQLLCNEIFELKQLPTLAHGRVALVGDAAHAMTPNLGQGACQALEDAVELGSALGVPGGVDVMHKLAVYNKRRLARVHKIARRSHSAGLAASLRGRVPTSIRNTVVRALPAAATMRAFDTVVDWHPPLD